MNTCGESGLIVAFQEEPKGQKYILSLSEKRARSSSCTEHKEDKERNWYSRGVVSRHDCDSTEAKYIVACSNIVMCGMEHHLVTKCEKWQRDCIIIHWDEQRGGVANP